MTQDKSRGLGGEPLMDIVVLVHDQAGWADLCVRAVEVHTKNSYRLIIVDSASVEPATKEWLGKQRDKGHTIVSLAENKSFSSGVNAGVDVGRSKFIVVLNDDAIVTEGWDTALLQDANEPGVGLVGARSNYASGAQMDPNFLGEPPFLVFVCVALKRTVWDKVGPLDAETFDGFSSEDLDYSWRVRKAGLKLKVSNAFVLHAGSRTLSAELGNLSLTKNNEKYNQRLIDKWGKDWVVENVKLTQKVLVASYHPNAWALMPFAASLVSLKQTPGYPFSFYHHVRSPIHLARQLVCDYATDNGFDVLVQLDDDATFPPDLIRRLVGHNKEVVCAMAYQRKAPYRSVAYSLADDGQLLGAPMEGIEHTGLRKVDISGFHCSAIRTSVIKKLRAFKDEKNPNGIRQYFGGFENKVGEDFAFCLNLKKVGVPVYVDTDLISGHISDAVVVDENYRKLHSEGRAP